MPLSAFLLSWLLATPAPAAQLLRPGVWQHTVETSDGTRLSLFRYVPAVPRSGPPLLMIPELGFTHDSYDLEGLGLATFLQSRGREVFVLEPRGQGAPSTLKAHGSPDLLSLRNIVHQDVPRALAEVRRLTAQRPDVLGHGFGGTLLLAAVAGSPDIGSIIALATPVEPALPNRQLEQALSGTSAFGEDASRFEFLFLRSAVISSGRSAAIRKATSRPLPAIQRGEWLQWMRTGDLPLGEGASVRSRLTKLKSRTYLVLPLLSYVGHPEYASPLREEHPDTVKVRLLSKLYLHTEDYSHLSVLLGEGAPADVFEPILRFLEGGE